MNTDIEACVDHECNLKEGCQRYLVGRAQSVFHVGAWRMTLQGCDAHYPVVEDDHSNPPVKRYFGARGEV